MPSPADLSARVEAAIGSDTPGLQYVVAGPEGVRAEYAVGCADVRGALP
jgi:hypothetical protein